MSGTVDISNLLQTYEYGDTVQVEPRKGFYYYAWVMAVSEGGRLICRSKGSLTDEYIRPEDVKTHVKQKSKYNIGSLYTSSFRNADPVSLKFSTIRD